MANALVLGAGRIGSVMAADLAAEDRIEVTVADTQPAALESAAEAARAHVGRTIDVVEADLTDEDVIGRLVAPFDVVVGAVTSAVGFDVLKAVARTGTRYSDVSFMAEDARRLDEVARSTGARIVFDCGVAPGLSNVLAAHAYLALEVCDRIDIYVGGLPEDPRPPFLYKAAFDPRDVLEQYTRPARLVEGGQVVVRDALSEPELLEFPGVGTLEAFNTDGLRSLAALHVPFMREKTLRYPGHRDLIAVLAAAGFFSTDPIEVAGAEVRPFDLAAELLVPAWTYGPGETDLTVMRVIVSGKREETRVTIKWDLVDRYDRKTGTSSMARTTGFPCTSVARMLLDGWIETPGVHPTERLADDPRIFARLMADLESRGVVVTMTESSG